MVMDGNKNDTGKELDKDICTHIQSILHLINADFNYVTLILWRQDYKLSIGATGEDLVTNAHINKSNFSYDVTIRCDVKISQPKRKGKRISSRLIGEV